MILDIYHRNKWRVFEGEWSRIFKALDDASATKSDVDSSGSEDSGCEMGPLAEQTNLKIASDAATALRIFSASAPSRDLIIRTAQRLIDVGIFDFKAAPNEIQNSALHYCM